VTVFAEVLATQKAEVAQKTVKGKERKRKEAVEGMNLVTL